MYRSVYASTHDDAARPRRHSLDDERRLAGDPFNADKPEIFEDADFSLDLTAP